jgi:hypothetical protein
MNQIPDDFDWSVTTFEGTRRLHLRRALALTLRERMQSVEDMAELAELIRQMPESSTSSATRSRQAGVPEIEADAVGQPVNQYDANDERHVTSEPLQPTAPELPAYSGETLAELGVPALIDLMVGDEDRVPRNVIDECARRGEAMIERLRTVLEDDGHWQDDVADGQWWLLLHAAMILGLIPEERAGLLLVNFMRRIDKEQDDNLPDWLAGYWPALFRNKPDAVLPALRTLCEDRDLDWYTRANAVDPVIADAQRQGGEALDDALNWAADIAADENEDWDMRLCVGNLLLDFPRARHRPLLENLAKRQSGSGVHFTHGEVRDAFLAANDRAQWRRFEAPWAFYAPAAIEKRQQRWEEEDAAPEAAEREYEDVFPEEIAEPYLRAAPKIGRNDPCPCGSGRKYKKCCLGKDEAE